MYSWGEPNTVLSKHIVDCNDMNNRQCWEHFCCYQVKVTEQNFSYSEPGPKNQFISEEFTEE